MIKVGFKYKALSPKKTKSNKTMFNLSDYDKENPQARRYCTVFCTNDVEVYDKQEIVIEEIQSITLGEYKEKLQVSMFAKIKVDGSYVDNSLKNMAGDIPSVSSDDLPF